MAVGPAALKICRRAALTMALVVLAVLAVLVEGAVILLVEALGRAFLCLLMEWAQEQCLSSQALLALAQCLCFPMGGTAVGTVGGAR